MLDWDWDSIATLLMEFQQVPVKEHANMFNLWQFDPNGEQGRKYLNYPDKTTWVYIPDTIRRCSANAVGVHGLVLDYDNNKTIQQVIQELDGIEYVLYTSFRFSHVLHKFRVIIPFTRMLSKEEFQRKQKAIRETFPEVDNASFSTSQAIFRHSGKDPSIAISCRGRGSMVDPDWFEDEVIVDPITPISSTKYSGDMTTDLQQKYKQAVLKSLLSCSGLRRGASKGTGGPLLVAICKSCGLEFADFRGICMAAAASDSILRDTQEQETLWRSVGEKDQHITAHVRDKFIAAHGGQPVSLKPKYKDKEFVKQVLKKRLNM
jgi:hypothetical protein